MSNLHFLNTGRIVAACATALALAVTGGALTSFGGQGTGASSAEQVLEDLIDDGARVAIRGEVRLVADAPAGLPSVFVTLESGQTVAVDQASLSVSLQAGQVISGVAAVPGEVIAQIPAPEQAELVELVTPRGQVGDAVMALDSQVGQILIEAVDQLSVQVSLSAAKVVAAVEMAEVETPKTHRLDIVFMSSQGRGKFWSGPQIDAYFQKLSDYWVGNSRGQISGFTYSYADAVAIDSTVQCSGDLGAIQQAGANALGLAESVFSDTTNPRHLIVLSPEEETDDSSCNIAYAGLAWVGRNGLSAGGAAHLVPTISNPTSANNVMGLIHELGHNFSLLHAGSGTCPDGIVDGAFGVVGTPQCTSGDPVSTESYGDKWNVMGNSTANYQASGLNGFQKVKLGLIDATDGLMTVQRNGVYDLTLVPKRRTGGTTTEAIRVINATGDSPQAYWLEYDSAAGGVVIRRGRIVGDSMMEQSKWPETLIASPGRTRPGGAQVFKAGQSFAAASGTMTIRVDAIDTTGAGVHIELNGTEPSISLTQTTWEPTAAAQSTYLQVLTNQGSWSQASADVDWLEVGATAGLSGSWLIIKAALNSSASARTGRVSVGVGGATATLEVVQAGGQLTLPESPWEPTDQANSVYTIVRTDQPSWTASSNATWLTVTPSSGVDGSRLTMAVTANPVGGQARIATVTVTAGGVTGTITVIQAAGPTPTLTLTPTPTPSTTHTASQPGSTSVAPTTLVPTASISVTPIDLTTSSPSQSGQATARLSIPARPVRPNPPPASSPVDSTELAPPATDSANRRSSTLRIQIAQKRVVLAKGKSIKIPAAAFGSDGTKAKLTYKSSRPMVAKVTKSGKITARRPGKAAIWLTAANGAAAKIKLTVVARPSTAIVRQIKLNGVAKIQTVDQVSWANVTWKPTAMTGVKVKFSSTNRAVVVADKTGRIQAVAPGQATLKVKVGGKTKSIRIKVVGQVS